VFGLAAGLVDSHRSESIAVAQAVHSARLKQLLLYLVEKVLDRPESASK
jgi:hypothetical protein